MTIQPHPSILESGTGPTLVFLHGWGSDATAFHGIIPPFSDRFHCIAVNLPGFGGSEPPPAPWCSVEYADWLESVLEQRKIHQPILLGHSFGGKVAAQIAARGLASALVLMGSAGIPPKRPISYYLRVYTYKTVKLLAKLPILGPLFGDIRDRMAGRGGSADYHAAQGVMRASLVRSVNEDLRPVFGRIPCPTLLIWGKNDSATPPSDGDAIRSRIPGSGLVLLENAGHYVFIDQANACVRILTSFLDSKNEG